MTDLRVQIKLERSEVSMCLLRADLRAVTRMERDMTRSRTDAEDGETLGDTVSDERLAPADG